MSFREVTTVAHTELHSVDDVAEHLAATRFSPADDAAVIGKVGLEAELFVLDRTTLDRSTLAQLITAVESAPGVGQAGDAERPAWTTADGHITEEPGGQLELITDPEPTLGQALDRMDALEDTVELPLHDHGLALAGTGLDAFHPPGDLSVQLDLPRYRAMGEYFTRRGTHGNALMCASASLQINVDLGPARLAADRWLVANMIAPSVVATFANSPTNEAVNGRSLAWMRLDPTRTGIPALLATGVDDPVAHLLWNATRADVMLVQREGGMLAGRPGWTFGDWVRDGHPDHGPPTTVDLDLHMSTLFPEVRMRGFLEVRGVDQLPRRWRPAPAVLLTGLLYDEQAAADALALVSPRRRDLPRLQHRAARRGLTDPLVWAVAGPLWEIALAGATRLGPAVVDDRWLAVAEAFLDRFTRRRRHLADEQREMGRRGPQSVLEWAR